MDSLDEIDLGILHGKRRIDDREDYERNARDGSVEIE